MEEDDPRRLDYPGKIFSKEAVSNIILATIDGWSCKTW